MNYHRGGVYWWSGYNHNRTHIQTGTRPVVIVSNDVCNELSPVIAVVPLTTHIKSPYPQQVPIIMNGGVSIVLADQITTVPVDELGSFVCTLKDFQMEQIDRAIKVQLGLIDIHPNSKVSEYGTR